jgi:hypothetical protein
MINEAKVGATDTQTEALEILRGLIERLMLHPVENGFEVELIGEIAAMVDLGAQNKTADPKGSAVPDAYPSSLKVVAGERYLLPQGGDLGFQLLALGAAFGCQRQDLLPQGPRPRLVAIGAGDQPGTVKA